MREPTCNSLVIERSYVPDRDPMLAALRAVLGLPRRLPEAPVGGAA